MSEARPKIEIVDTAAGPDAPFAVGASEIGSRERYALKAEDTFAVIDAHGDINADGAGSDGVFHADTLLTKCASKYESADGEAPHADPHLQADSRSAEIAR